MDNKLFKQVRDRQKKDLYSKYVILFLILFFGSIVLFAFLSDEDTESIKENVSDEVQGISTEKEDVQVICVSDTIDQDLVESLQMLQEDEIEISEDPNCGIHLTKVITDSNKYEEHWHSIFVPVARVDSPIENIDSSQIPQGIRSQNLEGYTLIWNDEDSAQFNKVSNASIVSQYKEYSSIVKIVSSSNEVIAFLPLSEITPKMKILPIDGIFPYDNEFYLYNYPLSELIWISSGNDENTLKEEVIDLVHAYQPDAQFDQSKFATFLLTGHSAVGARQYVDMNENPANDVQKLLRDADITHISNENSFTDDCEQIPTSTILCGSTDKMKWLEQLGVDIVSLTGSGILDYGRPVFEDTLEKYNESEIRYYAGGKDINEARTPHISNIGESKIGFLGYTTIGPRRYLATNNASGNTAPDSKIEGDGEILINSIDSIKNDANLIVVEMGWGSDFGESISLSEEEYSDIAVENGADIVFGTTSHIPKKIEFKGDSVVFYGLGDFLYYHSEDQRHEGLIIENYLYDDRYIGFRAYPIYIDDSLQIKHADVDKKREILNTVFSDTFTINQ